MQASYNNSIIPYLFFGTLVAVSAYYVANNTTDESCINSFVDALVKKQKTQHPKNNQDQEIVNVSIPSTVTVYLFSFLGIGFFPLYKKPFEDVAQSPNVIRFEEFIKVIAFLLLVILLIFVHKV